MKKENKNFGFEKDRRKYERLAMRHLHLLAVIYSEGEEINAEISDIKINAEISDISETGICFRLKKTEQIKHIMANSMIRVQFMDESKEDRIDNVITEVAYVRYIYDSGDDVFIGCNISSDMYMKYVILRKNVSRKNETYSTV